MKLHLTADNWEIFGRKREMKKAHSPRVNRYYTFFQKGFLISLFYFVLYDGKYLDFTNAGVKN